MIHHRQKTTHTMNILSQWNCIVEFVSSLHKTYSDTEFFSGRDRIWWKMNLHQREIRQRDGRRFWCYRKNVGLETANHNEGRTQDNLRFSNRKKIVRKIIVIDSLKICKKQFLGNQLTNREYGISFCYMYIKNRLLRFLTSFLLPMGPPPANTFFISSHLSPQEPVWRTNNHKI